MEDIQNTKEVLTLSSFFLTLLAHFRLGGIKF